MKILKSWLQKHIVETLPSDEEIEQALILKSSEVEAVEKIKVNGDSGVVEDTVFDIKVLPDRAHYMLSHWGIAYDLCAVLNLTLKNENLEMPEKGNDVKVKVETDLCNRYSATLITGIENKTSPIWLKNALEAIDARAISGIVDATNYVMFDTGQPLHAFDADKVVGGITVRMAKDGEGIQLLPERIMVEGKWEEKERILKLTSSDMVIADDKGPLAIAGVKGGLRAVVTAETKNIILESASFNPVSVRRTSTKYNIRNDSSKRFENEITAHTTGYGISCFLKLIKEISPKCKLGLMSDVYKKLPEPWTISVTHKNIEAVLNFSISEKRVVEILEKLLCKVIVKNGVYEVTPPFPRLDLIIAEDIIDEIGRIEGLDKVKSVLPEAKNNHEFSKGFLIAEKIKDFFMQKGFTEIQTRTFASKGDIEVAYPMASDKGFLRTSLQEGITSSIDLAISQAPLLGLDKIQIFEIGKAFPASGEELDLCFAISYVKKIKNKDQVMKTELENLLKDLETELGVKLESSVIANSVYVKNLDKLEIKLAYSSINSDKNSRVTFKPFSSEPFMVRDIALFVDGSVTAEAVQEIIKGSATAVAKELLVKGPDLFDQFEKEGKKSLAFRMIFQANDRTLTDTEVNGFMEKVYGAVKEKGWQVR
jgi:phenylalanyl-tRNA synthetase beta chain